MKFYKKQATGMLYETPDGKIFQIPTYVDEYPSNSIETITKMTERIDNQESFDGFDRDKIEPIDKKEVPYNILESLRRRLDKDQAP